MSGAEHGGSAPVPTGPRGPEGDGPDGVAGTSAAPSAAPQPLTSLSALLGGDLQGGQACDADGNCD